MATRETTKSVTITKCSMTESDKDRLQNVEAKLNMLSTKVTKLEQENNRLRGENDQLNNNLSNAIIRLEKRFTPVVAFTAILKTGYHLPKNCDPLPFNSLKYNESGPYEPTYDISLCKFRCPVKGTYLFALSMQSGKLLRNADGYGSISTAEIWTSKKGKVATVLSRNNDKDDSLFSQAATTVFIECTDGEKVWVRPGSTNVNAFFSNPETADSVFTGVLIKKH